MNLEGVGVVDWKPQAELQEDVLERGQVRRLPATLDRPGPPRDIPALWHWLAFVPLTPTSELSLDGHPARGGLLPPVRLPRRMYAGGRLTMHGAVEPGELLTRRSQVTDVSLKNGRSGVLVFVTLEHSIFGGHGLLIEEQQDFVYRDAPPTPQPAIEVILPHGDSSAQSDSFIATEPLLFRFSALTFNSHRIHYDVPYATAVEGYPALVVHGPLVAMKLAAHAERHLGHLSGFSFRSHAPAFAGERIDIAADHSDGALSLAASVADRVVMRAWAHG